MSTSSFVDQIYGNLQKVDKGELEALYEELFPQKNGVGIEIAGDGRTLHAITIGTNPLSSLIGSVGITAVDEAYRFGSDIVSTFRTFNKQYGKSFLLIGSSSGRSSIPFEYARILEEQTDSVNATFGLITANPDSPIGNMVRTRGDGGVILKLNGRESNTEINEKYLEKGILGDLFESEVTALSNYISMGILDNVPPDSFYKYFERKIDARDVIERDIQRLRKTEAYQNLIDDLCNPDKSCFIAGEGPEGNVAKMTNIRMGHVRPHTSGLRKSRKALGANQNYVIGETNTPNMDKDSILIGVSCIETSPKVSHYLRDANRVGAETFIITGDTNSKLAKNLLWSYNSSPCSESLILTTALIDVGYRLVDGGITVNEDLFNNLHVRDKK